MPDEAPLTSSAREEGAFPAFLSRHQGLFSAGDVRTLAAATVAIAGVGGVGGRLAETLARSGVGSLKLADPDHFAESNLNRQGGSTIGALGELKTRVVGDLCRSVSPIVRVEEFEEGISDENLSNFLDGVSVVVDGTDYTAPSLGLRLSRAASARGIPVVLGVEVGFGVWHTVIDRPGAFERLMGLGREVTPLELDTGQAQVEIWRWVLRVPPYLSPGTLAAVASGEIEAPAIAPAVELSAALLSTDVVQLLLGRRPLARAPLVHGVDLRTGRSWRTRPRKWRFLSSAVIRRPTP